jgi:hypothetical protein
MAVHYPDDRFTEILNQGGVTWLREGVGFNIQPKPPQLYTQPIWGDVDRVAAVARGRDQHVLLGIGPNYPPWIARGGGFGVPSDDTRPRKGRRNRDPTAEELEAWRTRSTHWENFVKQVVSVFSLRGVTHFYIGNEPNDSAFYFYGREEYINQLIVAADVISKAGYKVCAPDITSYSNDPFNFLRACLTRLQAVNLKLDVVTIHGYPRGGHLTKELVFELYQIVPILREYGVTAPVWLTETGVDNTRPDALENNGKRVVEICSWIGESGTVNLSDSPLHPRTVPKFLQKVFFFVWSDEPTYGWLDSNLNPRPNLWNAYRSVTGK